ncbi:MAG: sodium-dependent bicarbonate transport family permease [Caulobacter sp.]|nr:sodium-dependent bicarbonate transport family permease [Caulobacter sp.]
MSPMILFFALGAFAGAARSDLSVPEPIAKGMSLYLMAAIGLKGGIQVAQAGFSSGIVLALAAGVALSLLLPIPAYALLRKAGRLDRVNAAAVAAHYGSVSVVTFVTGTEILASLAMPPAGYMVAVMAAMETPAIITGLLLARGALSAGGRGSGPGLWHETFLNGSVVLLIGSFVIGLVVGKEGAAPVLPFFESGFRGVLCLFLLDMGLIAARRLRETRNLTWRLLALGIAIPIVQGSLGVFVGSAIGLDVASAATLGILAASASYIAVPAVMRLSLPQADPGISLGMALAVTFPFNVVLGIPGFIALATRLGA